MRGAGRQIEVVSVGGIETEVKASPLGLSTESEMLIPCRLPGRPFSHVGALGGEADMSYNRGTMRRCTMIFCLAVLVLVAMVVPLVGWLVYLPTSSEGLTSTLSSSSAVLRSSTTGLSSPADWTTSCSRRGPPSSSLSVAKTRDWTEEMMWQSEIDGWPRWSST